PRVVAFGSGTVSANCPLWSNLPRRPIAANRLTWDVPFTVNWKNFVPVPDAPATPGSYANAIPKSNAPPVWSTSSYSATRLRPLKPDQVYVTVARQLVSTLTLTVWMIGGGGGFAAPAGAM